MAGPQASASAGAGQAKLPELGDVIAALRRELSRAQQEGSDEDLRFRVGPVELEFETAVTYSGGGEAGVRLYVFTLGAKGDVSSASTQRVKLVLQPLAPAGADALVGDEASQAGPPGEWAAAAGQPR
jgi:Trypsin-co-occurring domain 2